MEKKEEAKTVELLSFVRKRDQEKRGDKEGNVCVQHDKGACIAVPVVLIVVLLGAAPTGVKGTAADTEEQIEISGTLSKGPLDSWSCAELIVCSVVTGSGYGLVGGTSAVATIWIAEVLSASREMVSTMWRVPLLGVLTGAGIGAVQGLGMLAEQLGPSAFWEAVGGGVMGAGEGARVAGIGGAAIGAAVCAMASVAVRNVVRGGDLRVALLMIILAALGASRVVLSLAPEAVAMATFVGSILGSAWDPISLKTLGIVAVGGMLGVKGQRSFLAFPGRENRWILMLTGGLMGAGSAMLFGTILGFPLQVSPVLINVPVGAAMAFLTWKMCEALCQSAGTVMEKLFGVLSINIHCNHSETEE